MSEMSICDGFTVFFSLSTKVKKEICSSLLCFLIPCRDALAYIFVDKIYEFLLLIFRVRKG